MPGLNAIAVSIWIRTILYESILLSGYILYTEGFSGAFELLWVLIEILLVNMPMLPVLWYLLRVALKIPYRVSSCFLWMAVMAALINISGILLLVIFFDGDSLDNLLNDPAILQFLCIIFSVIAIATFWSTNVFRTLKQAYQSQERIQKLNRPLN